MLRKLHKKMTHIKIYGSSCPDCTDTKLVVEKVIKENNFQATVEKVEDINQILNDSVFTIPAISVDGKIVIEGRCPTKDELVGFLG